MSDKIENTSIQKVETNNEITMKCERCGVEISMSRRLFNERKRNHTPYLCKECMTKHKSEKSIEGNLDYWANLTPEERELRGKQTSEGKKNMSPEAKEEMCKNLSKSNKESYDRKTPEEKEAQRLFLKQQSIDFWNSEEGEIQKEIQAERMSKEKTEYWATRTPEEMELINLKKSIDAKNQWENITPEEIERISIREQNRWKNMSEEEKQRRSELVSEGLREHWKHVLPEVKQFIIDSLRKGNKEYFDNLTPEEREILSATASTNTKLHWESLTPEERAELKHKQLANGRTHNKFHQKFEEYFKNSVISQNYYLQPELPITYENDAKCWDYGIFDKETNTLQMVVDLDGQYYHADNCDYDGIHSKEEYDEKRFLYVPEGVKVFIIYESRFTDSFKRMVQLLITNYEEYIDLLFFEYSNMGFPFPYYSEKELISSWKSLLDMNCDDEYHQNLSLNTRVGDRIIQHFHPSIYYAHIKGKPSPYEAWQDPVLLRQCIENRIIYQNTINPNKIVQGFNVAKIASKISIFSAGRAKLLINKYLSEYNTIFDPFCGFGGRMLGALSLGKKYIGNDINGDHVLDNIRILNFLNDYEKSKKYNASIHLGDTLKIKGTYECLFTCPPYGDKESWNNSKVDTLSCDDWIDICMNNFKCKKYLFVVDKTIKYKDYIVDSITNKSHFNKNNECVVLINNEK